MALLLDRRRRAGRYLAWKVRIFAAGAVLGLAGILLDEAWLRVTAIVVLALGVLLRLLPGGAAGAEPEEEPAGVEADEDDEEVEGPA